MKKYYVHVASHEYPDGVPLYDRFGEPDGYAGYSVEGRWTGPGYCSVFTADPPDTPGVNTFTFADYDPEYDILAVYLLEDNEESELVRVEPDIIERSTINIRGQRLRVSLCTDPQGRGVQIVSAGNDIASICLMHQDGRWSANITTRD